MVFSMLQIMSLFEEAAILDKLALDPDATLVDSLDLDPSPDVLECRVTYSGKFQIPAFPRIDTFFLNFEGSLTRHNLIVWRQKGSL